MLTPKQRRNQRQTVEVSTVPPGGGTSYGYALNEGLAEVEAATRESMSANTQRQEETRRWLEAPITAPAPSGDLVRPHESHVGFVGEATFGIGQSPAHDLLPPATSNPRLPEPPPPPAPVTVSSSRPNRSPGFWLNQHQSSRPTAPATPLFVTVDTPGGRSSGLLAFIRRLFRGGTE